MQTQAGQPVTLKPRITCPHCWHSFAPEDVLWVSAHPELRRDPLLGEDAQLRFLPTRFDVLGHALDARGVACHHLACPNCHLGVPRVLLEMESVFLSIVGAPFCGKSYFLASTTWHSRTTFVNELGVSFVDADPTTNQVLNDYEERLFLSPRDDMLVALPKTAKEGDLYESVRFGERAVWYPKPFVFTLLPESRHPMFEQRTRAARALCLYDNAGEHFLPGGETPDSPGTHHLSRSQALLYLFDPTQHPKIRKACTNRRGESDNTAEQWSQSQHQVLLEVANRLRNQLGLPRHTKYQRPLIVVVTKYDAWSDLSPDLDLHSRRVIRPTRNSIGGLNTQLLREVSASVRLMLLKYAPEIVAAADSFWQDIMYIPVSSLGHQPTVNPDSGAFGVRPKEISQVWVEAPLLYALHRAVPALVNAIKRVIPNGEK